MSINMQELRNLVNSKKYITIQGRVFRTDDIDYITGLNEHSEVAETELVDFIYGYKNDFLLRAIESSDKPYVYLMGIDGRVYTKDLLKLISQNEYFVPSVDIRACCDNGLLFIEF